MLFFTRPATNWDSSTYEFLNTGSGLDGEGAELLGLTRQSGLFTEADLELDEGSVERPFGKGSLDSGSSLDEIADTVSMIAAQQDEE